MKIKSLKASETTLKCLCCGTEVRPLILDESEGQKEIHQVNTEKGVVTKIQGNYGSAQFDMTAGVIAICDKCIELSIRLGRLIVTDENLS